MRKLFNLMLVLLLVFSWYRLIDMNKDRLDNYNKTKDLADTYYEKEIYAEALKEYKKLEKMEETPSVQESIVKSYIKLDKKDQALAYMGTSILDDDLKDKYFEKIFASYVKDREYKYFNKHFDKLNEDKQKMLLPLIEGQFEDLKKEFIDFKIKDSVRKVFSVKKEKWQLINQYGKSISREIYEEIYDFNDYVIIASMEGRTRLYTLDGEIRGEFGTHDPVYIGGEDIYLHISDEGTNYIDKLGKHIKTVERGSVFSPSKKALIKNKGWKIVDENFKTLEKIDAEDIKFNSFMEAIFDNFIIVKGGKYRLYDIKNKKYSQAYEDIDFPSGGLIAVKDAGKWGYIDRDFNQIIKCEFNLGRSFKSGLGVVETEDKKFILINSENKKLNTEINGMINFNNNGVGFIKKDGRNKLIRLKRFIYENY